MKRALVISALLHVAVIVIAYFGMPSLFEPEPVMSVPVTVDVVMATPEEIEKTQPPRPEPKPQAKAPPPGKPAPPPRAEPAPPPQPPAIPQPPPMPAVDAPPEPAPEPEPPPPKPRAKPEPPPEPAPRPKAEPKPAPEPEPREAEAARVAPKPRAKPTPPKEADSTAQEMAALLKNLAKPKPAAQQTAKTEPAEKPKSSAPDPRVTAMQRRAVESELSKMVRQQIVPCWNIPAGAKDARDMKIGIRVRLARDGSIIGAPELIDSARLSGDPFFRAVAESARRALQNPRCQPLRLPYQQYEIWKSITFNFDPSEALGP